MRKLISMIYLIFLSPGILLGESVEIHIINQLDEDRGYCLDIKGYKLKAQTDKGLQAHTCYSYQGEIAVDQSFDTVKLNKNQFFLPAFNVCMEAESLSASAPIRLNGCNTDKNQEFNWDGKGRIQPIGNVKLCLTVNQGESKKGGGGTPVHLKRSLSLEPCDDILAHYQIWGARKID